MAHTEPSLLERLQGVIERTYDLDTGVRDIGRYVIGDEGYRRFYGRSLTAGGVVETVGAASSREAGTAPSTVPGARTLVRESGTGQVAVSVYYPDRLIDSLERNDPTRVLHDGNVDDFVVLVEELDHFLVIAERVRSRGVLSLLDLELHANVTKHLVLSLFVARLRGSRRLSAADEAWIRWHLFEKAEYSDPDPAVRGRYRDAARLAARYVRWLARRPAAARVGDLRRFHRMPPQSKIACINALS